ncbi:hypothetical protein [Mycobacterium sp. JS623]|uniref:hypothetical protein n=1 Tax=Mycobacterium sp. JS623 TaxID=212767 RepID=UPI0018DF010B|nr:hypothetical protein [Mycobacterium sp. JS623]
MTVAITVMVVGKDSGNSPTPTSSAPPYGIASANDKGPVAVITEDPTCAATRPILQTLADVGANGWNKRDATVPSSAWTPEMRSQYEAMGNAMRNAADQMVALAKLTPHRGMRELYEQYIAYSRAYVNGIPTYKPVDDKLALVSVAIGRTIGNVCAAISYGSAPARWPLTPSPASPSEVAPVGDPAAPERFLPGSNPVCGDWSTALDDFDHETADWLATPSDIPASQLSPQQRAVYDAVAPTMNAFADKLQGLGEDSGNLTLRDFAELSAQYRRAYVQSLPTYVPADNFLSETAISFSSVVKAACGATKS